MGLEQEGGKVWSVNLVCSPMATMFFFNDFYDLCGHFAYHKPIFEEKKFSGPPLGGTGQK